MKAVFTTLRRPALRRMVAAQFFSELGDGVVSIALPLYVYGRTGSAVATSSTFAVQLLAGAVLGFAGGVLADGFDRRRILVLSYLARSALLVGAFTAGPLWVAVGFGVLARAAGQLDNPAFDAMVPEHALTGDAADLQQVLALRRFVQGVSLLVGPSVGALAVELIGARSGLLVPAGAFVAAFAVLLPARGLDRSLAQRRAHHVDHTVVDRLVSMRDGVAILVRTPVVRRLVAYTAGSMIAIAVVLASAIVWFEERLGVSGSWYGVSMASYGIGTTLGLAWAGGRSWHVPLPRLLVCVAPIYAAGNLLGVVALEPWLLGLGWFVWGVAYGPELVLGELLVVQSVPEVLRGRAFAAYAVIVLLGSAAGYALAGPLLETIGPRATIAWTSAALLVLGALWLVPIRPAAQRPVAMDTVARVG